MTWEEDSYFDADDGEFRPYLPPEDRLWRHPAEVGAARAGTATVTTPWPRSLLVGGAAVAVLAILTSGMVLGLRGNEPPVDPATEGVVSLDAGTWGSLTDEALDGIVTITVTRANGSVVQGSGFAFRSNGRDLLTSSELLTGAETVSVTMRDGTTVPALISGADRRSGIAVLQTGEDAPKLRAIPLQFGPYAAPPPAVGDEVLLISPGTRPNDTDAVTVAAVDKCLDPEGTNNLKQGLIQLNEGFPSAASGSPVMDVSGRAVGVAIDLADESGSYVVPSAFVGKIAFDLIDDGKASHSGLGIDVERETVRVDRVYEQSAAGEAGVRADDVITELDGVPIDSLCTLNVVVRSIQVGKSTSIAYRRGDQEISGSVTMGELLPD